MKRPNVRAHFSQSKEWVKFFRMQSLLFKYRMNQLVYIYLGY